MGNSTLTNSRLLRNIYPEFSTWVTERNLIYDDFSNFCDCLEKFVLDRVLVNEEAAKVIAAEFDRVLRCCNTLDYDECGVVEAYAILHLLDRYHRFQLISQFLIEKGYFPIRKLKDERVNHLSLGKNYEDISTTERLELYALSSEVLDVGTGPAPALYAISAAFELLKRYGKENDSSRLEGQVYSVNYVESGRGFRNWLHHFTEFLNSNGGYFRGPYHHGDFFDISELDLQHQKQNLHERMVNQLMDDDWEMSKREATDYVESSVEWKNSYRYNLIVYSNFLTALNQVNQIEHQIKSSCESLRNGGLLVVAGARDGGYPAIYRRLNEIICNMDFMHCVENQLEDTCYTKYSFSDDLCGQRIGNFYNVILERMKMLKADQYISQHAENFLNSRVKGLSTPCWAIHVFRKQVPRLKYGKYYRKRWK